MQSIPAAEAVDVPVDTRIALRFSHPVDVTDLTPANVTLIGPTGRVSSSVVGAEGGMLAFITPTVDLAPGTTYTTFIQGVRDPLGVPVASTTVRFTTHRFAAPATAQPQASLVITPPVAKPVVTSTPTPATATTPAKTAAPAKSATAPTKPNLQQTPTPAAVVEDWVPSDANRHGKWRVLGLSGDPALASTAAGITPLSAPSGQPGVTGLVMRVNGEPLPGVAVSVGSASAVTDAQGRFLLTNIATGSQQLLVDGTAVTHNGRHYTKHYLHVSVDATQTLVINHPIYLSRVDPASEVTISSPASQEIVLTHPAIPGLEVHIPEGTVLRDAKGKIVTKVSITPIALDRAPYPAPSNFSAYFTLQPGGAFVDGDASHAIKVIYPNYSGLAPGSKVDFYNYDPSGTGWTVYGHGTVTPDGTQVTPDDGAGFRQIMGFGLAINGNTTQPAGPIAGGCTIAEREGDPVDCATGFFTDTQTDMVVNDVIPISVTRSYQSNDPNTESFGVGMNFPYAMHLYTTDSGNDVYLVQPDGSQIHYALQSQYVWQNLDSPTAFYGSVMRYIPGGGSYSATQDTITVTLSDKTVYTFVSDKGANQLLSIADANGNTVTVTLSNVRSGTISQVTSPNGRYIQFTYDSCQRVTQATDNLNRTVKYTYYPLPPTGNSGCLGGLYQVTDQNGHTETYAYDSANRLQSLTDRNGNRVFYNIYNPSPSNTVASQELADNALWQFSYSPTGTGHAGTTTITDPNGHITVDTFNANGYVTNKVLAQGLLEQETYIIGRDTAGHVLSVTDQLGRVTTYNNYDAYGHPQSVTQLSGTSGAVTTNFGYDPVFQQLATITDPLSHTTHFYYDAFGKLNQVTNALNHSWVIKNNAQGLPTSIADPLGNTSQIAYLGADVSSVKDALGRTSNFFTDEVGRVTSASDPLGNTTQYGYDAKDQLLTVTDANNGVTTIGYDYNGNVTSVQDPRKLASHGYTPDSRNRVHIYTDPLGNETTYYYDGVGNLTSVLDRKGQTTRYSYDGLDRLHVLTYPDGSTLTITWDGGNRPQKFIDTVNGTVSQTYDGLDRLTQESGPQGTINYQYDAGNRRSFVTIAGQSQQIQYAFDAANRLSSITQGTVRVGWSYDAANRFTGISLPNGITSTVVPDAANEISSITYAKGATTIASVSYGYDADGHRTSATGTLVRPILDAGLAGTNYDAGNHLTALSTGALTYDGNFNLQTQAGANPASYTWNDRNQLTGTSNGTVLNYDALGRLVSRTQAGTTTSFLYDGSNQVTVNGSLMIRGPNLDEVETQVTAGGTINYLTDGLGSASMLTDSNGNVTTLYSYGAYGATATSGVSGPATVDTSFKYTGADYNAVDDLYYLRNRYYSPHLQRFISEDPIGLAGGINMYAYVDGDPVSEMDPLGLQSYGGLMPANPTIAEGLSAVQAIRQAQSQATQNAIASVLPHSEGVSVTFPAGPSRVFNFRYKNNHDGGSCTVGWGAGNGANFSTRFSASYTSASGGDPTGFGLSFNASTPALFGPFGYTVNSTNYFNSVNSYSYSAGPATVGGSPSYSVTLVYTVAW